MDDNEKQQLHEDIRLFLWKLAGFDMLRVEYMGDTFIMGDKFIEDFSKAWGKVVTNADNPANNGVRDYIPQHIREEQAAFDRQQKANSTNVSFDNGAARVEFDTLSDRVLIWTGRGTAEIRRVACAEIGRLLIELAGPAPVTPGWEGGADTLRSAPLSQNEKVARQMEIQRKIRGW